MNKGRYVTKSDQKTCNTYTAKQNGNFEDFYSLTSTRAKGEPMKSKGHLKYSASPGQSAMQIYLHLSVSSSPADAPPNGVFKNTYSLFDGASGMKAVYGHVSANGVGIQWWTKFSRRCTTFC